MLLSKKKLVESSADVDVCALPFLKVIRQDELAATHCQTQLVKLQEQISHCLSLLRHAFDLDSAVLLVPDVSAQNYFIYASSSCVPLIKGPYAGGEGVLGCLKLQDKISISPYTKNSPGIPFHKKSNHLYDGFFFAMNVPLSVTENHMLLCLDSQKSDALQHADLSIVNASVSNIRDYISVYCENMRLYVEGDVLQRAFDGLRKLNTALSLSDVYQAISQTVRNSIQVDFCAIASVSEACVCMESWSGDGDFSLLPEQIPLSQSVFGQVVKYRHSFPDNGLFSCSLMDSGSAQFFRQFSSFLVLPCVQPRLAVRHVLIIANRQARDLTHRYKNLFDLISDQLAIKLDLAVSHEQIRSMALQDALTGISNLRAFNTAFHTMYERAQRSDGLLSLVACDIDHFKQVNDNYGHPCGDQVLKAVANALHEEIRTIDMVARTGGEEFRILLEGADLKVAAGVAERIRQKVEQLSIGWQGVQLKVSISMGIATFANDKQDKALLETRADQALYRAKSAGRNRVCVWCG